MRTEIRIERYDRTVPPGVIEEVLAIKDQHLLRSPDHAAQHPGGFLVGTLDQPQVFSFLKNRGHLYVAKTCGQYAGYLLVTGIEEFFGYFSDERQTETSHHQESATFTPPVHLPNILLEIQADLFVYHVAVDPVFPRSGIGSLLMKRLFLDFPDQSFTADVLIDPVHNGPSISFFQKHHFEDVGTIDYFGYRGFGDLKTKVLRRSGQASLSVVKS